MATQAAGERRGGFTLIELLIVISVIAILAAMILPGIISGSKRIRENLTRTEIGYLGMAMEQYYIDWGAFPPDKNSVDNWGGSPPYDSGECLAYYLGVTFRVNPDLGAGEVGASMNADPCYEFPPNRISNDRFVDRFGPRADTDFYQFDNNLAERGSPSPNYDADYDYLVGTHHPRGVDIWTLTPQGKVIGNW